MCCLTLKVLLLPFVQLYFKIKSSFNLNPSLGRGYNVIISISNRARAKMCPQIHLDVHNGLIFVLEGEGVGGDFLCFTQ